VRISLIVVLLANLAFLAWSQWIDVPVSAIAAESASKLPTLQMVGERKAAVRPVAHPVETEHGASSLAQCVSVGPFDDLPSASRGADVLRKKGFDSRQRSQPAAGTEGYWVYVAGLTTPDVAKLAMQSLEKGGIREATALLPSQEERRISVGLFMDRDQADKRIQEVRRLGLKAEIAERKLPSTLYWVDVAISPEDGALPAYDLYRGPSSHIGAKPCPEGSVLPGASPSERAYPPAHKPGQHQSTAVAANPSPR
jgi:hypothetical protein